MGKVKSVFKKYARAFLLLVPFVRIKIKEYDRMKRVMYNSGFEPGHFFSPVPNLSEITEESKSIFTDKSLKEVNLNTESQINLLEKLQTYYPEYPYNVDGADKQGYRYSKKGAFYRFSDSVFLFTILRNFEPKKIIEVGSGHSSALMLDTDELFFDSKVQFTFIEPYPTDDLKAIFNKLDKTRCNIIESKVQSVDLELFQQLEENDILFIDSTHVSKVGSDVNHLIFEVLPTLKPGVLIHFHDIFNSFELPEHWVLENRWFWNENYLLHAFLMNNENYEILAFNTYLQNIKTEWFKKQMPECLIGSDNTGSIWIQKKKKSK